MKKLLTFFLIILIISSIFCLTAFAEEGGNETGYVNHLPAPNSDVVLRVAGLTKDAELVLISDHTVFDDGWNEAMKLAVPKKLKEKGVVSIVVDIYTDWKAKGGKFTQENMNGAGFDWDTIYIPEKANVILNLNGHTINRGLTEWENNGEVICIDEEANVVINGGKDAKDQTEGTVTGGYSAQFGGGIHINKDARVTLNNVRVIGNRVEDASGAGISVAKNAELVMNGGCVTNNSLAWTYSLLYINMENYGVGVYASKGSTLKFNDVDFMNNHIKGGKYTVEGSAIFLKSNCELLINGCYFEGNGKETDGGFAAISLIESSSGCDVDIIDSIFRDNGEITYRDKSIPYSTATALLQLKGDILIDGCTFEGNDAGSLLYVTFATMTLSNTTISRNLLINALYFSETKNKANSIVSGCTVKDNFQVDTADDHEFTFYFETLHEKDDLTFTADNVFGEEVNFNDKDKVTFLAEDNEGRLAASILGDGSVNMIISILALIVSASTAVALVLEKKKSKRITKNLNNDN